MMSNQFLQICAIFVGLLNTLSSFSTVKYVLLAVARNESKTNLGMLLFLLLVEVIGCIASVVLMIGLYKQNYKLLQPWIIFTIIHCSFEVLFNFGRFGINFDSFGISLDRIGINSDRYVFNILSLMCISAWFKKLGKESERRQLAQNNYETDPAIV